MMNKKLQEMLLFLLIKLTILFLSMFVLFLLLILSKVIYIEINYTIPHMISNNFIVIIWIITTLIYIYLTYPKRNFITPSILYLFGVYRTFIINPLGSLKLIEKNISLFLSFIYYNIKYPYKFLPRIQIWLPLFKRGGYLSLLNSSRTRWQLSKLNSKFKNK